MRLLNMRLKLGDSFDGSDFYEFLPHAIPGIYQVILPSGEIDLVRVSSGGNHYSFEGVRGILLNHMWSREFIILRSKLKGCVFSPVIDIEVDECE